ncbi:AMP-binding protein [uncultured Sanguibacteroides sp.]|uniref:AMP-binding protein n=1 Tax=uncultured Sanguibacteroides sp. TaxID=1635151 RepID=UPI0025D3D38A|nr:AMP-binding protein [uncultured Sanguibacteroides sp.]
MTLKKLTLPELLKHSCSKFAKNLSLNFVASGKRTYQDLYNDVIAVANHLIHLNIKKGDKVAILSANMPNWGITQFAIASTGAIAVPILPGFCSTELQNILEHAEVKVIFVSRLLAKCLEDVKTPFLKHKILINNFASIPEGCYAPEELDKLTPDIDLNNYSPLPDITVEEEDTASIIYTSGTTGFSKGVELTHKNLVWDARQCRTIQHVDESDRFLSILPMAHTYENTLGLLLPIMFGAQIFYLDRVPTPKLLVPAMQKVHPTVILSVPLIIEKIYKTQIVPKFNSNKIIRTLYGFSVTRKFFNRMAGKKLMETFGGQLKFFGVGGSKIDGTVEQFLKEARFPYAIGYGLTETAPMAAGSNPSGTFLQGVGPIMEGVSIKINEPDEKGEGEIWIKGPNVMKGYYKRPELNAEVFTEDGWFKTGDLGSFDKKNRLSIRGRIKTMILGASGENIYPEEIESIINNFRFVNESLVVENSGKLVAMVHFNMEELEKHYKNLKNQADNYKAMISDYIEEQKKELREYVNARVNNFSKLQLVMTQHEPFEKTPTHKIKRFLYNK